ncbi:MAG TPA: hypothetical protein VE988_08105 [Gemmataceae bacterium]|nr:hypothetical protein [Gemmataceae bacterium]
MLTMLRARWYDLIKAPFRGPKLLSIAGAGCAFAATIIAVFCPSLVSIALTFIAAFSIGAILLGLIILTRLYGKVNDLHSAVSLYANIGLEHKIQSGLFLDGWSATPCFMLFLYKCLAICKPQRILELGSGQTTKLLARYYQENPTAYICTIEHNADWLAALRPQLAKSGNFHDCRHAPLVDRSFSCKMTNEKIHTLSYDIPPDVVQQPFNLILIDGPDNGPGSPYTREGFLQHVPGVLAQSFTIVFDDTEREDERRMVAAFQRILHAHNIKSIRFELQGVKTQTVFCSIDLWFLCSV